MTDDGSRVEWDPEAQSWAWECDFCEPFHTAGYETLDDAEDAMVDHDLDRHNAGQVRTS